MSESRVKKHKKYKKRIGAYEKEMLLYEFALKNRNKVYWAKEIADWFDYSVTTRFGGYASLLNTRLGKYIKLLPHKRGEKRFVQVKDVIWIPKEKAVDIAKYRSLIYYRTAGLSGMKGFAWIERKYVPFWMLAEYGGSLKDDAFIRRLEMHIKGTEHQIEQLKLGEKWIQK